MAELPDPFHFGRCELRSAQRQLLIDGAAVPLGGRAFDLLVALIERRDRVVPKSELFDVVWPGIVVEENNLQVQISALRKLLGATAIATVPNRGYRFTAAEPQALAALDTPGVGAAALPAGVDGARLLIADDNKVNRLLLARSLQLLGHQVTSVENGRQALERLRREPFDLLLLDLEMPELDGFALLEQRAADEALREVPVIVTSSLEGVAHVARCIELGADDYLRKPVNAVLLKARVGSSLEKKRLRDRQKALLRRLGGEHRSADRDADDGATRSLQATVLALALRLPAADHGDADDTVALLNDVATLAFEAIDSAGGRVLQAQGDGVVALFEAGDAQDAARAAVRAECELREMVAQLNADRAAADRSPLAVHAGFASGALVLGTLVTPDGPRPVGIGVPVHEAQRLALDAGTRAQPAQLDPGTAALLGPVERGTRRRPPAATAS